MKKRASYIMGFVLIFSFLLPSVGMSQGNHSVKKEKTKIEHAKKKKLKISDSKTRSYYSNLLQKKDFVFAADFVRTDEGLTFFLDPSINFISVVGDTATFQFGKNGALGWNGVGGVTAHGTIVSYKYSVTKKQKIMTVTADANLVAPVLPPHFILYVSDDGTAQLVLNLPKGGRVTMTGRIYSPQNSGVFEGQSAF